MDFTDFIAQIIAPIHELGHCIFGWLSLNPTIITGWNRSTAVFDTFFLSIGGYITEFAFMALMFEAFSKSKKAKKLWWTPYIFWLPVMLSIEYQADIEFAGQFFNGDLGFAQFLWYGSGIFSLLFMIVRRVNRCPIKSKKLQTRNTVGSDQKAETKRRNFSGTSAKAQRGY